MDGAIFSDLNKSGAGCMLRNHAGLFLAAWATTFEGNVDPLLAESLIVREALSWLKKGYRSRVAVESDALELVIAINSLSHMMMIMFLV